MERYPEQLQAEDYAHYKGTAAPIDSIRRKVAATFTLIEELLGQVPSELTQLRPSAGKWSVHEIVDHLVVSLRRAVEELNGLIAGRAPEKEPIPEGLLSEDPFALSFSAQMEALATIHRRFLKALSEGTEATDLDVKAPIVMVVPCTMSDGSKRPVRWLESYDWKAYAILFRAHTLEHVHQIERTLKTVGEATGVR